MSNVIIKVFATIFFNDKNESFDNNEKMKHIFNSLIIEIIILIIIIIRYAIQELQSDLKSKIKFEGRVINNILSLYFSRINRC